MFSLIFAGLSVNSLMLRLKAKELSFDPEFKVSLGWYTNWKRGITNALDGTEDEAVWEEEREAAEDPEDDIIDNEFEMESEGEDYE